MWYFELAMGVQCRSGSAEPFQPLSFAVDLGLLIDTKKRDRKSAKVKVFLRIVGAERSKAREEKEESLPVVEYETFSSSQPSQTLQGFQPCSRLVFVHFSYGRFGGETVGFPRASERRKNVLKGKKDNCPTLKSEFASYPLFTFPPSILTVS